MKELEDEVREVADLIQPRWTPRRAAEVAAMLEQRWRPRTLGGFRRGVALLALGLGGALIFSLTSGSHEGSRLGADASGETRVRFPDGSEATLFHPTESAVWVREVAVDRLVVGLQGRAHFAVARDPRRVFRVEAGALAVEVLGTRFEVDARGTEVRVAVEEGRVRVLAMGAPEELGAGEARTFVMRSSPSRVGLEDERLGAHERPESQEELRHDSDPPPRRRPGPTAGVRRGPEEWLQVPEWVGLAEAGDYAAAYESRVRAPGAVRGARYLMLAADVARFSHHPADGVAPLERLLHDFPDDPLAPLAAFTLGRSLLDELGRPREAARAFDRAVALAADGPLAEDALARAVESWSRAEAPDEAGRRARDYLARFPDGRRARAVRRHGGLE